jgi:K+-transporting ATPase KdpF subunit
LWANSLFLSNLSARTFLQNLYSESQNLYFLLLNEAAPLCHQNQSAMFILLFVLSVAVFLYMIYVLLRPEKF